MTKKTCFVIMGFGKKTNYKTGQTFDLDKTYKHIIKPVFEELDFMCFRADEIPSVGVIDVDMYDSILKADFVVADLSTLNPNAFYELGIRHGVQKNTTMIIAEKGTDYPFDLNHNYIHAYEHLGTDIGVDEAYRFKALLSEKAIQLLEHPKIDSPLYTYFPKLKTPTFTDLETQHIQTKIAEKNTSVSDFLEMAEDAKENRNYVLALRYLEKAVAIYPYNDFIHQRRVLCTYKLQQPDEETAFKKALTILNDDLNLETTTDPETLGLAGAIYKRWYALSGDDEHFEQSVWLYSRGFYVQQDYYTGINLAFLKFIKASELDDGCRACAYFYPAQELHAKVERICKRILDTKGFKDRNDKEWVYFTLAEIACAREAYDIENEYIALAIREVKGDFALASYDAQRKKLTTAIQEFKAKHNTQRRMR